MSISPTFGKRQTCWWCHRRATQYIALGTCVASVCFRHESDALAVYDCLDRLHRKNDPYPIVQPEWLKCVRALVTLEEEGI